MTNRTFTRPDGSGQILQQVNLPDGHFEGLGLSFTSVSQVTVAGGSCMNEDDTFPILPSFSSRVVDIAVSGLNGLDTGTEAADTWYSVWLIAKSSDGDVATLLSLSSTQAGLTFPTDYDKARRVGWVRNDASSNFLEFIQEIDVGRARVVQYPEVSEAVLHVLTDGTAVVFTTASLAAFVPPTSRLALLLVKYMSEDLGGSMVKIREEGTSIADPVTVQYAGVSSAEDGISSSMWSQRCSAAQEIEYENHDTDADIDANIWVVGFHDLL